MKRIFDSRIECRDDKGRYHREDGPAIEWTDGDREWWLNGKRHRLDGPAVEGSNESREWWFNGRLHRLDGPAIEENDGYKEWWFNGSQYSEEKWFNLLTEDKKLNYILKGEK